METKDRHPTVKNCFFNNLFQLHRFDGDLSFTRPLMFLKNMSSSDITLAAPKGSRGSVALTTKSFG
jgi:hypothetical protein